MAYGINNMSDDELEQLSSFAGSLKAAAMYHYLCEGYNQVETAGQYDVFADEDRQRTVSMIMRSYGFSDHNSGKFKKIGAKAEDVQAFVREYPDGLDEDGPDIMRDFLQKRVAARKNAHAAGNQTAYPNTQQGPVSNPGNPFNAANRIRTVIPVDVGYPGGSSDPGTTFPIGEDPYGEDGFPESPKWSWGKLGKWKIAVVVVIALIIVPALIGMVKEIIYDYGIPFLLFFVAVLLVPIAMVVHVLTHYRFKRGKPTRYIPTAILVVAAVKLIQKGGMGMIGVSFFCLVFAVIFAVEKKK